MSSIRADRLLRRAGRPAQRRLLKRVAPQLVRSLLKRARNGQLELTDLDARTQLKQRRLTFGTATHDTSHRPARAVVHDRRAFEALVSEGSIGLGRGFVEGWWTSDDPVAVVRFIIANIGPIDRSRDRLAGVTNGIVDRRQIRRGAPDRHGNKDDIAAHYDLGNEFFATFLDPTMTYSSAYFGTHFDETAAGETPPQPDERLADASNAKYDMLLAKLGVTADDHLLEIGTGWGGLAIRAATTIGCRVTTTTISAEQLAEARRRVEAAGVSSLVTLLDVDWRDLRGTFDKAISIEMIEAVDWRDYNDFFAVVNRCLTTTTTTTTTTTPIPRLAMQAICLPDDRWQRAKHTEDFIRRFVFPNGCLPSVAALTEALATTPSLRLVDVHDISPHYAETLRRWRAMFDQRIDEVRELGLDDRFVRLWRFYFAYCEAGFRERHCLVHQLVMTA